MNEIKYIISVLEEIVNTNNTAFNACTEEQLIKNYEYTKLYKSLWHSNLRLIEAIKFLNAICDE